MVKDVIINFDLKNFFFFICYKCVKGLFFLLGYFEVVVIIFVFFCIEFNVVVVELDG